MIKFLFFLEDNHRDYDHSSRCNDCTSTDPTYCPSSTTTKGAMIKLKSCPFNKKTETRLLPHSPFDLDQFSLISVETSK
ncbi:hypothetical protein ILYODFUR_038792 [Ilyodon furcidens]|uniref:Uncharacterized protein n=1 Tax=Ilyodon furcidens TaxID=33524 RepID=A0ABV0UBX8_9TELE